MTSADQAKLAEAVTAIADRVAAGEDATAAAYKTASELGLTPGRARLAANAYNIGSSLAQQSTGESAAEKYAGVPVADADEVVRLMRDGDKTAAVKTAAAAPAAPKVRKGAFAAPPAFRPAARPKTAAARVPAEPEPAHWGERKLARALDDADKAVTRAETELAIAADAVFAEFGKLANYFAKSPYDRLPLRAVVKAAFAYSGPTEAKLASDAFAASGSKEKHEPDTTGECVPDWSRPPFSYLSAAKTAAAKVGPLRAKVTEVKRAADVLRDAAKPAPKTASALMPFMGALGGATAARLSPPVMPQPSEFDQQTDKYLNQLNDPGHEDAMRQIRARTMLARVLSDPDDPVSGYPPEQVLEAYNQLARLTPRSSEQPAVAGPWLRRALAGRIEPFEAKTVTDVEKTLSDAGTASSSVVNFGRR